MISLYEACLAGDEAVRAYFLQAIHGMVDYVENYYTFNTFT
jgi:hypothetical protein